MKDIVILVGSANGSALALIRAIKKEVACKAYVLCTNKRTAEIIASSKYVNEVHNIASSDEEVTYVGEIKEWYATKSFEEKPILYFTFDTACYYIDNNRKWFEEKFELCLPSSEIIKTYTQKGIAEVKASEAGLTVPKTQIINSEQDIKEIEDNFLFPVILKPRATYLKANIDFKIKIITNKEEFVSETTNLIKNNNSLLCQEFIPGDDKTSFYYLFYRGTDGSIHENIGRKTLQSTPNGGIMVKGLVEYNNELSQICCDFLKEIDYKGIGGIEFKNFNDEFYFIEMSTRLEGFFKIAEISNSPLSLLSYYDISNMVEERNELVDSKQVDGMVYMDFISTLVTKIKQRKYFSFICDVGKVMSSSKTKLNVFSTDDPKPFFMTLKNLIAR